jgi:hypothetical protein
LNSAPEQILAGPEITGTLGVPVQLLPGINVILPIHPLGVNVGAVGGATNAAYPILFPVMILQPPPLKETVPVAVPILKAPPAVPEATIAIP